MLSQKFLFLHCFNSKNACAFKYHCKKRKKASYFYFTAVIGFLSIQEYCCFVYDICFYFLCYLSMTILLFSAFTLKDFLYPVIPDHLFTVQNKALIKTWLKMGCAPVWLSKCWFYC